MGLAELENAVVIIAGLPTVARVVAPSCAVEDKLVFGKTVTRRLTTRTQVAAHHSTARVPVAATKTKRKSAWSSR
jgi:hypothetical protein